MRSRLWSTLSFDNLSHTFLGVNGLYSTAYRAEYDLSSEAFVESTRHIVDRKNRIIRLEDVWSENPPVEK